MRSFLPLAVAHSMAGLEFPGERGVHHRQSELFVFNWAQSRTNYGMFGDPSRRFPLIPYFFFKNFHDRKTTFADTQKITTIFQATYEIWR